jgi:hypothetical protein
MFEFLGGPFPFYLECNMEQPIRLTNWREMSRNAFVYIHADKIAGQKSPGRARVRTGSVNSKKDCGEYIEYTTYKGVYHCYKAEHIHKKDWSSSGAVGT